MKTLEQKKKSRKKLLFSLIFALVFVSVSAAAYFFPFRLLLPAVRLPSLSEGEVRVHFLDVGQGDCTVVEFGKGDILVIDAGDGSFIHENNLVRYLKGLNPNKIEMLLTHGDRDHFGGFRELLRCFPAEKFYLPLPSSSEEYAEFLSAVEKSGCPTERITRYGLIERENATLVCLSPFPEGETEGNASSTVLYLQSGKVRGLFLGDIPDSRERILLEEYRASETFFDVGIHTVRLENIELLKVAHHGSKDGALQEWLELLRPKTAVISCGAGNSFRHPAAETLSNLKAASPEAEICRIDELGPIFVSIKGGNYTVEKVL